MKIDYKILCIPPFISTTWNYVISVRLTIRSNLPLLSIDLVGGGRVDIPNLDPSTIKQVFECHAQYVDRESMASAQVERKEASIRLGFGIEGVEGLGGILQHNPEQAEASPIPKEILSKIRAVSKAMGLDETGGLPQPEPHCHCPYCQMARAMQGELEEERDTLEEEIVSDEELSFRSWEISEEEDRIYNVRNLLDHQEKYRVSLKTPIGCTCGQTDCEHLHAVLRD